MGDSMSILFLPVRAFGVSLLMLLSSFGPLHAQTVFQRAYGGTLDDYGNAVRQTTDSGYIIAGTTSSFAAVYQSAYLIKTNSHGDTLWTRTYAGIGNARGNSVRQTSDT